MPSGERTAKIIREYLKTLPKTDRYVEAAFFGGSFTAVDTALQEELLSAAYEFVKSGEIDGIRLSTRPDFIDDEILKRLVSYGTTSIELGVQSMIESVLEASGRGHTAEAVKKAVRVIKKYPVRLGLQMMTGLPGDTAEGAIKTAEELVALKPDFVRIYPTLVIRDTRLFTMYKNGSYKPQSLEEAVSLAALLVEKFKKNNITVIRTGLAVTEEISPGGSLEAGPFHSAFGELTQGEILYNKMLEEIKSARTATFLVNPKDISKAVGNKKKNIKRFCEKGISVTFLQDDKIPIGEILRRD